MESHWLAAQERIQANKALFSEPSTSSQRVHRARQLDAGNLDADLVSILREPLSAALAIWNVRATLLACINSNYNR
jgi:hypothetical protein